MNELRIAFIQASNSIDVHWFKPLAFGYLKAYLMKNVDFPVRMEFVEHDSAMRGEYDIVGISSTSQDYGRAQAIAARLKKHNPDIITILGGHHLTCLPQTMSEDFDIGVMGEGEETFLELVKVIRKKEGLPPPELLRCIPGIVYRKDGQIRITERRELIRPLDRIPHPERFSGEDQYIFTSRGCPYRCAFCSSSSFWDKTRMFSAEYVVDEIEEIVNLLPEIEHITVEDDLFVISLPRFQKICDLLKERGLSERVEFSFAVRANLITDEFCEVIKRLNIRSVYFGAESASDRILKVLKKGTTTAQNQKALDILQKHGIPCVCSFIIGVPSETAEEVKSTYEFVIDNLIDDKLRTGCPVNILMPMPGTRMWEYAVREGIVDVKDFDWNRLSIFASYRHSSVESFHEWVELRKTNRSVYMNEDTLPEDELYEIMGIYEERIKKIEREKLSQSVLKKKISELESSLDELLSLTARFRNILPILEDISECILKKGGDPELINKTGELCYHLGMKQRAYQLFKMALEREPSSDAAWNNLGVTYIERGNIRMARRCFSKALEINPENSEAKENMLKSSSSVC